MAGSFRCIGSLAVTGRDFYRPVIFNSISIAFTYIKCPHGFGGRNIDVRLLIEEDLMRLRSYQCLALQTVMVTLLVAPSLVSAATETERLSNGHTLFTSIVTKKGGALVVTTPNGATHQLNENMARREHGSASRASRSKQGMK